jgi:hypothetical protein
MILKSSAVKKFINNSLDYLKFFLAEYLILINYINALIIGFAVNSLMGQDLPGKTAPYLIPVLVQAISKSMLKFKNRHMERLLQLPSEREDPVFIMKENGDIILSAGLTNEKFRKNNISNISQIIGDEGFEYLSYSFFDDERGNKQTRQIEIFSERFNCWYEIKIKCIFSKLLKYNKEYLIWFTDITEQKNQSKRMSNMLSFSNDIMTSLPIILEKYLNDEIFTRIADSIFSTGFNAVFIATQDQEEKLKGIILKHNGNKTEKSDLVTIHRSSLNTFLNQKNFTFISADISAYSSREDFEKENHVDERIASLLNCPINNFIYYQSSNALIIGFNKKDVISENDKILMKVIVNDLQTFLKLQEYISSYFLNYLKTLNEEF